MDWLLDEEYFVARLRPAQQVGFPNFLTDEFMGDAATREDQNSIRMSQHQLWLG